MKSVPEFSVSKKWMATAKFIEQKFDPKRHHENDLFDLSFLNGKKVIKAGFIDALNNYRVEGGMMIDYLDGIHIKRIVIGYNELGTWVEWRGIKGKANPVDFLKEKVEDWLDYLLDKVHQDSLLVVGNAKNRSYTFVDDDENKILSLDIKELKMMGSDVCSYFSKPFVHTRENFENFFCAVSMWLYGTF